MDLESMMMMNLLLVFKILISIIFILNSQPMLVWDSFLFFRDFFVSLNDKLLKYENKPFFLNMNEWRKCQN